MSTPQSENVPRKGKHHTAIDTAHLTSTPEDLTEEFKDLSMSRKTARKAPANEAVADSWEEDAASTESEGDALPPASLSKLAGAPREHAAGTHIEQSSSSSPSPQPRITFAPDGTPLSPSPLSGTSAPPNTPRLEGDRDRRRPEKTTAPAARMIAGALGVRPPKKTEEQKQYDKVVREKEARRREEEKERQKRDESERERLKREAWDG